MQATWDVPKPAAHRRRPNRLAVTAMVVLAVLLVWLAAGRAFIDFTGPPPPLIVVGWGLLGDTVQLGGHALGTFRLTLAALWLALLLAVLTKGFTSTSWWTGLAAAAVGLAGALAAGPLLVVAAVITGNLLLWGLVIMLVLLLFLALCLRIVMAPFRRGW